ncbi:zinc finger domain-containing protein [Natrinema salifodinae]|uniref:FPG and IleRS Zinc finger-containing protein n=1 Tax=Natrinema salifodinae TaxID=1202768 RepID=A0A1I0QY97_9EURY|nr:zinc finger domain-containing protein [Natrinema salifodinae]SEW32532.1 FPG and IleRS Zinc finger-containing protein [Natrinema salifodinae]
MNECPRCQGPIEVLSLGEASTVTCSHCGFADVSVEHQPQREEPESWGEAFNRFYDESTATSDR